MLIIAVVTFVVLLVAMYFIVKCIVYSDSKESRRIRNRELQKRAIVIINQNFVKEESLTNQSTGQQEVGDQENPAHQLEQDQGSEIEDEVEENQDEEDNAQNSDQKTPLHKMNQRDMVNKEIKVVPKMSSRKAKKGKQAVDQKIKKKGKKK